MHSYFWPMSQANPKFESKTISLCMIMKDESDWLPLCLSNVKGLVDEMIIVDTGSTDNSVEIARSFGAKVFFHPWVDDFAKVRNYSLQQATGDWVLVLDADEIINQEDHRKIRKLIENESACYLLTQRHYTDDVRLSGFEPCRGEFLDREVEHAGYFESALGRLFPNYRGIHYRGAVHELIEFCLDEIEGIKLYDSTVRIHHYGHTSKVKAKKDKSLLYTPLGEKKVNDKNRGWKEFFELAVEHNNNRRLEESVVAFYEAIKLKADYLESWINLGYVLCELGRFEEASNVLTKALELDPVSEEALCNLGVVYLRQEKFSQAEVVFRKATQIKPSYMNAWRNLSITLSSMKRYSEAALVLKKMLNLIPNDYQTMLSLGSLYLYAGNPVEALTYFSPLYKTSSRDSQLAIMVSQAIKIAGDAASSLRFLATHIKDHEALIDQSEKAFLKKQLDQESIQFFLS